MSEIKPGMTVDEILEAGFKFDGKIPPEESSDAVEFTIADLRGLTTFEPEKTRTYLNTLLANKISTVVERIELHMKQKYCKHGEAFYNSQVDRFECGECDKIWNNIGELK